MRLRMSRTCTGVAIMGSLRIQRNSYRICAAVILFSTTWGTRGLCQDNRLSRVHINVDMGDITVGVTEDRGWLLLQVRDGGSFLVRTDLETLAACAHRATDLRASDTSRIAYFDTTMGSTEAITFIRVRTNSGVVAAYQVIGEDGPWARTLMVPVDAAKRIFAGMQGIGDVSAASARPDSLGNIAPGAAFADSQVDRQAAIRLGSPPPAYRVTRSGQLLVQFVVDTVGHVDPTTFRVLSSTDTALNSLVFNAVTRARFFPASADGRSVRELVSVPFSFDLRSH
jgi:TonB family protein